MRLPVLDNPGRLGVLPETGPRSIAAVKVLRISVTDRCNFRCVYCMPAEGVRWLDRADLLSFEDIVEVVRAAVEVHGIRRIKLTGGEPTVRHGIVELVRIVRSVEGVEDLSLTTNGALLEDLARPLLDAGLDRATVSVDSLDAQRFRRITRSGDLAAVMRGLDHAQEVGFPRGLKINCVMMRGTNEDELADFARLTLRRALTVRFIEYMPLGDSAVLRTTAGRVDQSELGPAGGCGAQDRGDVFISEPEARCRIEQELGPLDPVDRSTEPGVGPATIWRLRHGQPAGRIGFISAMSAPFCDTCNRLRLTATGVLRSCLFEGGEIALRDILRSPGSPQDRRRAVARAMTDCVRLKPDVHSRHGNEQMSRIGG
jgi:cyclic pyranopterin phosphate synthase